MRHESECLWHPRNITPQSQRFSVLISNSVTPHLGEGKNQLSKYKSSILTRVPYSFNSSNVLKFKIIGELEIIQS